MAPLLQQQQTSSWKIGLVHLSGFVDNTLIAIFPPYQRMIAPVLKVIQRAMSTGHQNKIASKLSFVRTEQGAFQWTAKI